MSASRRIVFAGTPEFALPTLEALDASAHHLVGVLTQPDRAAGRGRSLRASPVKRRALELGLPLAQPASLRKQDAIAALEAWAPDLVVVAAYGLILPQAVLALPRIACVNVHASLLPRWRGAAPIQRAIIAGDTHTGISIMRMEAGLDTGPVYAVERIAVDSRDTGASLHDRLATLGATLMLEVLPDIVTGALQPRPQDESLATYAPRIEKSEARIDWSNDAAALARRVRAFNPWPVCECGLLGRQLRVWEAEPVTCAGTAPPGRIVATGVQGIDVATGKDALRLRRVQLAGRKAMDAADFLHAISLANVTLD